MRQYFPVIKATVKQRFVIEQINHVCVTDFTYSYTGNKTYKSPRKVALYHMFKNQSIKKKNLNSVQQL